MKRLLLLLAVLLVAGAAYARYDTVPSAHRITWSVLTTTGVIGTERACPSAIVDWNRVGATDSAELYGCHASNTPIGSCDLLQTFTTSTPASGAGINTGRPWFKLNATTAVTGESIMTIQCSNVQMP